MQRLGEGGVSLASIVVFWRVIWRGGRAWGGGHRIIRSWGSGVIGKRRIRAWDY